MRQRSGRTKERAENVVIDTRILHLAFLAPDIVEAILDGQQPADLDLEQLLKGIPHAWQNQQRAFGLQSC